MRASPSLLAASLAVLLGCSRQPASSGATPTRVAPPSGGARSAEAVAVSRRDGGVPPAGPGEGHLHTADAGTPRSSRVEIKPLTAFWIVPVGEAAVAPARATLDALRARYVAYGFELGAMQPVTALAGVDCNEALTRRVGARGTLLVVSGSVPCPTPFGAVNTALATGLVLLAPLDPPGPVTDRRLTALLASEVGEVLGLSMPCTDGRACCALRKARNVRQLDLQAATPCPAHASELDRIREAAEMQ